MCRGVVDNRRTRMVCGRQIFRFRNLWGPSLFFDGSENRKFTKKWKAWWWHRRRTSKEFGISMFKHLFFVTSFVGVWTWDIESCQVEPEDMVSPTSRRFLWEQRSRVIEGRKHANRANSRFVWVLMPCRDRWAILLLKSVSNFI